MSGEKKVSTHSFPFVRGLLIAFLFDGTKMGSVIMSGTIMHF